MKQSGASLIFVLIILALVSSISIAAFKQSLLEYKIHSHTQQRKQAFYATESCLNRAVMASKAIQVKVSRRVYCNNNNWYQIQRLPGATEKNQRYYQITAHNVNHLILQAVAKVSLSKQLQLEAWRQMS